MRGTCEPAGSLRVPWATTTMQSDGMHKPLGWAIDFDDAFWCEVLDTACSRTRWTKAREPVRTSNAGHCLFGGIVDPRRAHTVARTLLGPAVLLRVGDPVRSRLETVRSSPMGYHTGGVWPHDNAVIAEGLAMYELTDESTSILQSRYSRRACTSTYNACPNCSAVSSGGPAKAPVLTRWRAHLKHGRQAPCSSC